LIFQNLSFFAFLLFAKNFKAKQQSNENICFVFHNSQSTYVHHAQIFQVYFYVFVHILERPIF